MNELSRFPRTTLAHLPTPLEACPGVSQWLEGPEIWVKRDDQTGLGGGGNKLRKLEFLMAHALAEGADTVLTAGGVQSNHVRQTAAAAAKLGLACHAVLEEPGHDPTPAFWTSGNAMLDRLLGARLHSVPHGSDISASLASLERRLISQGARPYVIPVGGSNPVGALGYVRWVSEVLEQIARWPTYPAAIVLASGSAGTQAGILVGLLLEGVNIPVIGICVSRASEEQEAKIETLANEILEHLGYQGTLPRASVLAHDGQVGPGYGYPTEAMAEAVKQAAARDGLLLDPVYTGKAFAGLISFCREDRFHPSERVVFLHTGGAPALFAYPELVPAGSVPCESVSQE